MYHSHRTFHNSPTSRLSFISTYLGVDFAGNIGSDRFFGAIVWLFVTLLPRFALAFLKRSNLASAWDNFLATLCFGSLSGTSTMKSSGNSSLSRSFLTRCFRVSSYSIRWSFAIIRFLSIVSWSTTSSMLVCSNGISNEWANSARIEWLKYRIEVIRSNIYDLCKPGFLK